MTADKPEVVAWRWCKPIVNDHGETVGGVWELGGAPAFLPWWANEPLVRLSDYQRLQADHERLQAECERWKRGSEIRDEQNQDLHSFIMELKDECEKLVEALERISKRASEAECRQVPCSPIQRLFVDIMQQADDALAAYRKGGES